MRTECLLRASPATRVNVRVRFLQVVERQALRDGAPVDEVVAGGERHLTWQEAVEREVELLAIDPLSGAGAPCAARSCSEPEPLGPGAAVKRSCQPLSGEVAVGGELAA